MQIALNLPMAGRRHRSTGVMENQGSYGYYWSSFPDSTFAYHFRFDSSNINSGGNDNRALGFSVRCFLFGHKPSNESYAISLQEAMVLKFPNDRTVHEMCCVGDVAFPICVRCKKWLLND